MTIPTVHKLEPAFSIVERLGGKSAVAAELHLSASTLSRWCSARPKGTGGTIPQRYWNDLLLLAQRRKVEISPKDLFVVRIGG